MKKTIISSVAALALIVGVGSASAQTMTAAEMQAMIAQLTAQLALLSGTTTTPTMSSYVHPGVTLRVGSKGVAVTALQNALNNLGFSAGKADGVYGKGTAAAVKAFQMSKGLGADGVAGNNTHGALVVALSGTTTTPTTPGTSTGNGTLSGTEGYLSNDNKLGAYNNTKVIESEKDKAVYGFEVTAKDADQKIDSLSVVLKNSNGASSKKITRYASDISVWLDGKEIGRKSISNYSSDSSDEYTYRFTGMDGVVKQNMKGSVLIAVSSVTTMDSTDALNETWSINVGTAIAGTANYVSAVSANGRYRDYGSSKSSSVIDFQKAGGVSSDQKFKVTTASSNPVAQTVQVSNTADTSDALLLSFDAKAENAGMIVQKVPVVIKTTSGSVDGVAPNPEAIVKVVKLYANGTLLATESLPTGVSTQTVTFGNNSKLNYTIASNATVKFEIRADLHDIENTGFITTDFDNGDKVSASVDSSTITVELDNVNKDTVSNKTGVSTGSDQTLRADGMMVTMGAMSSTASSNNAGEILNRTISIPVTIKALDDTVYVDNFANNAATIGATSSTIAFTFEDDAGNTKTIVNSATLTSTNATVEGNGYRIDSGTEKTFNLTIIVTGVTSQAQKQYRVQLNQGQSFTDSALTAGSAIQALSPANAFETGYFALNLN